MTLTGKWKDILPLVKLLMDAGYSMDGRDTELPSVMPHDGVEMVFKITKAAQDG